MKDEITKSIIECGKNEFLENGFEKASLQEICKKSNITTGAFYRRFKSKTDLFETIVSPSVLSVKNLVSSPNDDVPTFIRKVLNGNQDEDTLLNFFEHRDNIILLLNAAEGTKYAEFFHNVAKSMSDVAYKYLSSMEEAHEISEEELHIFMSSYLQAIFEAVVHAQNKDEYRTYVENLNKFYNWEKILTD